MMCTLLDYDITQNNVVQMTEVSELEKEMLEQNAEITDLDSANSSAASMIDQSRNEVSEHLNVSSGIVISSAEKTNLDHSCGDNVNSHQALQSNGQSPMVHHTGDSADFNSCPSSGRNCATDFNNHDIAKTTFINLTPISPTLQTNFNGVSRQSDYNESVSQTSYNNSAPAFHSDAHTVQLIIHPSNMQSTPSKPQADFNITPVHILLPNNAQTAEFNTSTPMPPPQPNAETANFTNCSSSQTNNYILPDVIPPSTEIQDDIIDVASKYYKVADSVYAMDFRRNAWFEGNIVDMVKNPISNIANQISTNDGIPDDDGILYKVQFTDSHEPPIALRIKDICPRSRPSDIKELKVGETVMVNYNIENPGEHGFWYKMVITDIDGMNLLIGNITTGKGDKTYTKCQISPLNSIMKIRSCKRPLNEMKQAKPTAEKTSTPKKAASVHRVVQTPSPQIEPTKKFKCSNVMNENSIYCVACNDQADYECNWCGCQICSRKTLPKSRVVCSLCNKPFHFWCLDMPSQNVSLKNQWYCPKCKNLDIVLSKKNNSKEKTPSPGDKQKKRNLPVRTKRCKVPSNHFGPIPGVEVGTIWKYRIQVSESGIHRPLVGGIHGRETEGAYSIVLSGSFAEDYDNGEEFFYTGSGGRELTGTKRMLCDQTLTRVNKALAVNCNAPFDDIVGAESKDWKLGKPVRVIRNYKLKRNSKYAPEEGNRYDGIYKVVKYFPQIGSNGFVSWRYKLRRDDPVPAPWTEEGKIRSEQLGLKIIYPDGFPYTMHLFKLENGKSLEDSLPDTSSSAPSKPSISYSLDENTEKVIRSDVINDELWNRCKELVPLGKPKFLAKVSEIFRCVCCRELVDRPVTTPCLHNICSECLKEKFSKNMYVCPNCHYNLDNNYEIKVNSQLADALLLLFPGYNMLR